MANKPLSTELAQEAIDAVALHGSLSAAARALKTPRATLENRVEAAHKRGLKPKHEAKDSPTALKERIKRLEAEVRNAQHQEAESETIKKIVGTWGMKLDQADIPAWIETPRKTALAPGVPTLFLSDLHWGEVVHASQINGVNSYSMAIARQRMQTCVDTAIQLLGILSPKMDYPGIVVPLGGDMISGNIHEELQATNEMNTMPCVLDLYGVLVGVINHMADTFGAVFLPCVTGNHGRDTFKIYSKDRHHTSFDWLLYQFLAVHFADDRRVKFYIPDGPDAYYRIYNHRYLLTHGDQFRGGDGMIGALGPLIRGDHKKRSRNAQIDMEYDTMICGHWHQDIFLRRLIVNSSLKGMDEYAYRGNFPYEPPSQQLWVTHHKHGITWRMPIYVDSDRMKQPAKTTWVSFAEAA